jgi:hypothetical protein
MTFLNQIVYEFLVCVIQIVLNVAYYFLQLCNINLVVRISFIRMGC